VQGQLATVELKSYRRTSTFHYAAAQRFEKRLNAQPVHVAVDRISKNLLKGFSMGSVHGQMIAKNKIVQSSLLPPNEAVR